jgi:DMSO/TMAO reductase YedYZ molybdopterin-dependent catalytic subunit
MTAMKLFIRKSSLFILQFCVAAILVGCSQNSGDQLTDDGEVDTEVSGTYPSFITPIDEYFEFSIDRVPVINPETYTLEVFGAIENPRSFSLEELKALKMVDKTVTIECIHNPENGNLISTAVWKGFNLYDLLKTLGLKNGARHVKYICADGYYTTHTLHEIRDHGVLGALYMNQESIPGKHGYPLRFIIPGFYGVKNPGWVTGVEVMDTEIPDYWSTNGWETGRPIGVDTKIFFPLGEKAVHLGDTVHMGGAAFGGRHIEKVEFTSNGGNTWNSARITRYSEEPYVWAFWKAEFIPKEQGVYVLQFRSITTDGDVQPKKDFYFRDGTNSSPKIHLRVL